MTFFEMFPWIFLLPLFTPAFSGEVSRAELEKKIISSMYIERRFNSYIRPHRNESYFGDPVVVSVNLHILHLDVDAKNQNFDISIYFRQEWNDSRVSYDGEGIIDWVNFHDVIGFWTPDLFFVNEHTAHFHIVTKPNTFARIYPDGRVLLSQRLSIKASCTMNLRRYPFDRQNCPLRIESYGYQSEELRVQWKQSKSPITGTPNVIGYDTSYHHKSYLVNFDGVSFSAAELQIHIKRLLTDFFLHIYIPLTVFLLISWVPFWMTPKQSVLRVVLSLTAIVSCFMELSINNHLFLNPGYATALDVWVAFTCTLLFASVFSNFYVIYNCQEGNLDKSDTKHKSKDDDNSLLTLLNQLTTRMDFFAGKIIFPTAFVSFQLVYIIYIFSDSSVR